MPNANQFYPALRAAFTYKGKFICDPKDASTLALYINTTDWKQAGLTSADIPTNWSQLAAVAKKLTTHGRVGLVLDQSHSELEFLYLRVGTGEHRGSGADRRRGNVPHLLVGGAADGPPGPDRADYPVLPGVLERLLGHPHRAREPVADTLTAGVGRLVSGQLGAATEYPLKLAAAVAMTVPVAVVFFVFQKHILRTNQGALKE